MKATTSGRRGDNPRAISSAFKKADDADAGEEFPGEGCFAGAVAAGDEVDGRLCGGHSENLKFAMAECHRQHAAGVRSPGVMPSRKARRPLR